jgi:putative transposase
MPRPTRLNLPGVPQHITQRGNNRQACFFAPSDFNLYLALLTEASRKHKCAVHAYVLMTNHVHLLVTPLIADGLSLLMRDLGRDFVRQVNKTYRRSGTMWEGRFKSSLVDKDAYCLACYRYIELNPVRANMVADPAEYRWSSFRANALGAHNELINPHDTWLALGKDDSSRRRAYLSLFEQDIGQREIDEIRFGVRKGLPTGNDRFKQEIEEALSIKLGSGKRGRPAKPIR